MLLDCSRSTENILGTKKVKLAMKENVLFRKKFLWFPHNVSGQFRSLIPAIELFRVVYKWGGVFERTIERRRARERNIRITS